MVSNKRLGIDERYKRLGIEYEWWVLADRRSKRTCRGSGVGWDACQVGDPLDAGPAVSPSVRQAAFSLLWATGGRPDQCDESAIAS